MQTLNVNDLQSIHGGLSSGELATVAGLTGKTFVESLVGAYIADSTPNWTSIFAMTGATFAGVYSGFHVYHLITD